MILRETYEIRVCALDVYHNRYYVTITFNGGQCVES